MAGRRRLSAGMVRLLARHDGLQGYVYRREWAALADAHDLTRPLVRLLAGRVCVAAVNLDASTRALGTARRARARESGRRPSARDVERLARRQGLDEQAYAAALDRLREFVQTNGHTTADPLAAVRQAVAEANRP
jgi:signal transduction histidine kinase